MIYTPPDSPSTPFASAEAYPARSSPNNAPQDRRNDAQRSNPQLNIGYQTDHLFNVRGHNAGSYASRAAISANPSIGDQGPSILNAQQLPAFEPVAVPYVPTSYVNSTNTLNSATDPSRIIRVSPMDHPLPSAPDESYDDSRSTTHQSQLPLLPTTPGPDTFGGVFDNGSLSEEESFNQAILESEREASRNRGFLSEIDYNTVEQKSLREQVKELHKDMSQLLSTIKEIKDRPGTLTQDERVNALGFIMPWFERVTAQINVITSEDSTSQNTAGVFAAENRDFLANVGFTALIEDYNEVRLSVSRF